MKKEMIPKWQQEVQGFLGIKRGLILEGNVYDEYPNFTMEGDECSFLAVDSLDQTLLNLIEQDSGTAVFCDPLYGFYCYAGTPEEQRARITPLLEGYKFRETEDKKQQLLYFLPTARNGANDQNQNHYQQIWMSQIVRNAVSTYGGAEGQEGWLCFVLNFASRLEACNLYQSQSNEMFLNLMAATTAAWAPGEMCNTLVMVVDKYNDIPAWMYLSNPHIRTISITVPDRATRRLYLENVYGELAPFSLLGSEDCEYGVKFVAETEGLQCQELGQILRLAYKMHIMPDNIGQAFQLYKYGVVDNPWDTLEDDIVDRIRATLEGRVKGQKEALEKVISVASRAVKGLSGLHHSSSAHKPRGILFLAGPTGVGKTETAKALAQAIFGDENACLRFDMSEYREAHSDQKLFGAPPGYVGYESGGKLTNEVKTRPFSVLLFDEIEKASPTILDKFLQILEDGRMTDGQGNTVYFGETIIIFTSNIGLTEIETDEYGRPVLDNQGNPKRVQSINIKDPAVADTDEFRQMVSDRLTQGVKDYFTGIGRPELLNRLGEDNIVVFQFINTDSAEAICTYKLGSICKSIKKQKDITLATDEILEALKRKAIMARANGGRGIGNMLERELLNPFANFLCAQPDEPKALRCYMNENDQVAFEVVDHGNANSNGG